MWVCCSHVTFSALIAPFFTPTTDSPLQQGPPPVWMWCFDDSVFFPVLFIPACVSTGGSLTSLYPDTAWTRSSPKCSPNKSSVSWRNSTLTKVCVCVWVWVRGRAPVDFIRTHTEQKIKWVWLLVFDAGLCPNALHKRRLDTLRYLMYARFIEVRVAKGFICF